MAGLSNQDIMKIVNRYIGVFGGYLGDFTYGSHADFYPEYCDLDINSYQYEGTTRVRFIKILENSSPETQAKIIRGVLERFPINAENKPSTRTQEVCNDLIEMVRRLENTSPITTPDLKTTTIIVERAISDVETLLQSGGAISGIDRIHTALHGYLQAACDGKKIIYAKDDSITKLFKLLRQSHPVLQNLGSQSHNIDHIFRSFASILDALNPIRNHASVAHPTNSLLGKDEAMLVINVVRTLLHYLNAKLG